MKIVSRSSRFAMFGGLSLILVVVLASAALLSSQVIKTTPPVRQQAAKVTLFPTSSAPKQAPTVSANRIVSSPIPTNINITQSTEEMNRLIAQMSIEEKVGQLFLVFFEGPVLSDALRQMIEEYHIGGVVLFANSGNIKNLRQVAQLINDSQSVAAHSKSRIPLFVAIDQEGGQIVRLTEEATHFPSNMAVGATGSITFAAQMASISAKELRALGINMNLAPVLDVNDNPDNPVIGLRSFGSSPALVAQFGEAVIKAYKAEGVIATAKHFPGHGNTETDSHYGLPIVNRSLESMQKIELFPFQQAIQGGVDAIMTAHVLFPAIEGSNGLPATLSSKVLTQLLREKMKFKGLVLSDSMTMGAIDQTFGSAQASVMAFEAGADILAFGADIGHRPSEQKAAYRAILSAVRSKTELVNRLDESVRRILAVKLRYGLLNWHPVDLADIPNQIGTQNHRQAARSIAINSITLLQDKQDLLPVASNTTTLLVLPLDAGDFQVPLGQCIRALKTVTIDSNPDNLLIQRVLKLSGSYSKVIVVTTNARKRPGQIRLVQAFSKLRTNSIIVAALLDPYDLLAFPEVSTYVTSYGISTVSLESMAAALCGNEKFHGLLPVDLPGLYSTGSGIRSD